MTELDAHCFALPRMGEDLLFRPIRLIFVDLLSSAVADSITLGRNPEPFPNLSESSVRTAFQEHDKLFEDAVHSQKS